jgi:glycosyltransferase involved in cell wall biosynthesis
VVEDRVSGLLVRVDDPGDMAHALRELADSDALSARLGQGARAAYERLCSPEVIVARLLGIYREAIAERAGARVSDAGSETG